MPHLYSVEKIVHYQCDTCRQWWSISGGLTTGGIICPMCGMHGTLKKALKAASPPEPEGGA